MCLIGKTTGIDSLHSVEQLNKITRTEGVRLLGIAGLCEAASVWKQPRLHSCCGELGKSRLLIDKECLLTDQTARGGPELVLN